MIYYAVLTIVGLGLLVFSADKLVDKSVEIAEKFGLSPIVVGLTVIAFGTSFPELVFTTGASLNGSGGLAIGNIIGSNITNSLLILGIAAMIGPLNITKALIWRDGSVWAISTIVFVALIYTQSYLGALSGALLLFTLVGYLYLLVKNDILAETSDGSDGLETDAEEAGQLQQNEHLKTAGIILLALIGIALGSEVSIYGAVGFAEFLGVSEAVIGLSIIALGTSLPELATVLVCMRRNQGGMLVGNIIGSNIFNILACIGVPALFVGIAVPSELLTFSVPLLIAVSAATLLMLRTDWTLSRREGAACLCGYGLYVTALALL